MQTCRAFAFISRGAHHELSVRRSHSDIKRSRNSRNLQQGFLAHVLRSASVPAQRARSAFSASTRSRRTLHPLSQVGASIQLACSLTARGCSAHHRQFAHTGHCRQDLLASSQSRPRHFLLAISLKRAILSGVTFTGLSLGQWALTTRSRRTPPAPLNSSVMHKFILLAMSLALAGCVNAVKMCGLEASPEWKQLRVAPPEQAELMSLVKSKESPFPSYDQHHRYWFQRADGSLLLCRQDPQPPSDPCSSDGWQFTRHGSAWQAQNKWANLCPIE